MQKLLTANSCPKHMVMGPCGGVRADGSCEVIPSPCAFDVPVEWADPVPPVPLPEAPRILADFSSAPYSVPSLASVAAALAPSCDAVLVGEHQNRPGFPPHAARFAAAGGGAAAVDHAGLPGPEPGHPGAGAVGPAQQPER